MFSHAFVDEFGDPNLDTDLKGTTSHFILTAVLVKSENVEDASAQAEEIRKRYFQTGEMKSSSIGKNPKRRMAVLNSICEIPMSVYSLVVDKSYLYSQGFQYKRTFYKFLHNVLYKEIFHTNPNINVLVDELGRTDFMESFKKYIAARNPEDLFYNYNLDFEKSNKNVLIQCSDVLGGSIARAIDEKVKEADGSRYVKAIRDKGRLINIEHWPLVDPSRIQTLKGEVAGEDMKKISEFVLRKIEQFMKLNDDNSLVMNQKRFLHYLLLDFRYNDVDRYISADELVDHLNLLNKDEMSKNTFRSQIVAKTRDYGIVIASSQRGYKLPYRVQDIKDYLDHNRGVVIPMLRRLISSQSSILQATEGRLDILELPSYGQLRNVSNALKGR